AHVFHVEPDQKEHLAIELEGQWLSPEQAIAKGVPTAMKKLISTSRS
ncbi:adenine glycosylase, partial [Acinetobacter baumannii]